MEDFSQSDVNAISSEKLKPKWSLPKPVKLNTILIVSHLFPCLFFSSFFPVLKMKMNIRNHMGQYTISYRMARAQECQTIRKYI